MRSRRWPRRLLWLLLVLGALLLLLWLGLPALLKWQLPVRLGALLGRPVALAEAQFNPLRMVLQLQGLQIGAAPGAPAEAGPQLAVDRLLVDVDLLQTLRHRAPVLRQAAVDGVRARLARTAAGRYDIDDILARLAAAPATPPDPDQPPQHFALHNLALRDAQLRFDDRPVSRVHEVQALTLTLPFLSNLPSDVQTSTEPRLAFRLNGTAFDSGSQSLPFAQTRQGTLDLSFADLDLAPWLPYLPAGLPVAVARGHLGSTLALRFELPPQGRPTLALTGQVRLRDVALTEPAGTSLAAWQALALDLRDVQPLARRIGLGLLQIDGLVLDVSRDAQGRLNLQRLAGGGPAAGKPPAALAASAASGASDAAAPAAAAAAPAWQVSLDGLQIRAATARWRDASLQPAAAYTLAGVSLQAQALRWPAPAPVPLQLQASLHQGAADGTPTGPAVGTLRLDGQANDREATLALVLEALDLAALQPYSSPVFKPRLGGQLAARATLRWGADPALLTVALEQATLQQLRLQDGSGRSARTLAGVRQLQLGASLIDVQARRVALGRLQIDQPTLALARAADGQLDLSAWLPAQPALPTQPAQRAQPAQPAPARAGAAAAARLAPTPPDAAPPWRLALADLALTGGRIAWADAALAQAGQPLRADLSALKLRLQGLAWPPPAGPAGALPRLQLSASLGAPAQGNTAAAAGTLDWNGRIGLAPVQADGRLKLQRLPLHLFVPYAGQALPVQVLHADASLASSVRAAMTPQGLRLASDGDLQLTEVMVHTRPGPGDAAGSELLSWETLSLQGLQVALLPAAKPRIEVRELALSDFFSRLTITEQGRFNLQDMAATPADGGAATPAASAPTVAAASAPAGAPAAADELPIDLVLGRTELRNGRIDFSDRFIRPNYSARLTELNGSVGAFRSGSREMAAISLRGRAADTALLDISGQVNPTAQPLALDIRARATDLELAPLSPYAGKYAGYAIERGKLSMDVSYKIDADGRLDAKNQVILNQLTFGERVESPSATQLPVLLAVALLKDRNGVIDINLPVSGTVNDPQFSVGALIWKVVLNLLGKALTAPFSLLAGGSDDLSTVAFLPGTARVTEQGQQALAKVATALTDRPALKMTVTGAADTVSEREQAQRTLLEERLAAELRRERQRAAPAAAAGAAAPASAASAPAAAQPTPAERNAALKRLYQQTPLPDRPRNLINQLKDIPPAEMESRLLAGIRVTDETMRELALQRGLAVRDALMARGLGSERLFIAAPKLRLSGEGDAAWVPSVQLTLSTK